MRLQKNQKYNNNMEKSIIKAKKIECILGILFLIPPILSVFAFVLCLFDCDWEFAKMSSLSAHWTCDFDYDGGGGMSAAPIYLGLMALAGVWLVKDSIEYFFKK